MKKTKMFLLVTAILLAAFLTGCGQKNTVEAFVVSTVQFRSAAVRRRADAERAGNDSRCAEHDESGETTGRCAEHGGCFSAERRNGWRAATRTAADRSPGLVLTGARSRAHFRRKIGLLMIRQGLIKTLPCFLYPPPVQ